MGVHISIFQKTAFSIFVFMLVIQALVLYMLGQPFICECGYIKIWEGVVQSAGNSQHIADWYTFSHVIHGFIFYFFAWVLFSKRPWYQRILFALFLELSWEIVENTPWVIDHYREQALAQGYTGDSILNSIFDSLSMALGFLLAYRLPIWVTITIALIFEAFVGYSIRDNLTLNIVNLIYPFESIVSWQSGNL
jgi:Protein of unknown function (DUF2585)